MCASIYLSYAVLVPFMLGEHSITTPHSQPVSAAFKCSSNLTLKPQLEVLWGEAVWWPLHICPPDTLKNRVQQVP